MISDSTCLGAKDSWNEPKAVLMLDIVGALVVASWHPVVLML
jgi:hypothetical protein